MAMLDPIAPKQAVESYLQGRNDVSQSTKKNYRHRLKVFLEWCADNDIDNLNDLTGRDLHEFRLWRAEQVSNVTLKRQLGTVRQFLAFCENIEAVPNGMSEKMELPDVGINEEVNETSLTPKEAEAILEYLDTYEYASFRHVTFFVFWHTAVRISTLHAVDVTDFSPGDGYLRAVHRPETVTPLKNRENGKREINLSDELVAVIDDWIDGRHPRVEDEHGRMPLLGTVNGRAHQTTIRNHIYRVTRPCHYANECPHNRWIDDCEAAKNDNAVGCPSSVSPHAIRKGAITYHRNEGWPVEAVSDRADVSREVLDKHYDMADEAEKRERRERFLDRL